jgi:hypothetical protein
MKSLHEETDIILAAAIACHAVNNTYRLHLGEKVKPAWEDLDEEMKKSVLDGVHHVLDGHSPRDSHINWMKFKESHGWQYGEVEDPIAKTHPCMVLYDNLPIEHRMKDEIFCSVIKGVFAKHGRPLPRYFPKL